MLESLKKFESFETRLDELEKLMLTPEVVNSLDLLKKLE